MPQYNEDFQKAASVLQNYQVDPAHGGDLLAAVRLAAKVSGDIGIRLPMNVTAFGPVPIRRFLSTLRPGHWIDAEERLWNYSEKRMDGVPDFKRNVASTISSALLMSEIRKQGTFDFDRIGVIAEKVLAKEDLDAESCSYMSSFLKEVGLLKLWAIDMQPRIVSLIGENASLKTLSACSERWHHIQGYIDNQVRSGSFDISWDPAIGERQVGAFRAEEIKSSQRMISLGKEHNHCIGSYVSKVIHPSAYGSTIIMTLEDETGQTDSTMEILACWEPGNPDAAASFTLAQHKAANNHAPSAQAEAAARRLVDQLNAEDLDLQPYADALNSSQINVHQQLMTAIASFGMNIADPDISDIALEGLRTTLPKGVRNMTLADWKAGLEARGADFDLEPEIYAPLDIRLQDSQQTDFTKFPSWVGRALNWAGCDQVEADFSGGGDEGHFDDLRFCGAGVDIMAEERIKERMQEVHCRALEPYKSPHISGTSALQTLIRQIETIADKYPDYANNDGGALNLEISISAECMRVDDWNFTEHEPDDEDYDDDYDEDYDDEFFP